MGRVFRLLFLGLLPLAVGYLMNFVMMLLPAPLLFGSILPLMVWAWLCGRFADGRRSVPGQAALMNAPGLVMLALVLIQEIGLGAYWQNTLGLFSQLYFLTGLPLAATLLRFLPTERIWPYYIAVWLMLFGLSLLGCWQKRRQEIKKS